jgi:parallel beta-helix repeat protein
METFMKLYIPGILLILFTSVFAEIPVVENVRFEQRTDGSLLVDIYYDATDADGDSLKIIIEASDNYGATWTLPCTSLTGDVGEDIPSGTDKHVVWDFYADNPDTCGVGYRVRVTAYDNLCGQTISEDFTLTEDLICGSGCAIRIGAPNITLDLGGHTISGDLSNGYVEGVLVENFDGVTIRNGTIENFGIAIVLESNNATIENLTIKNLVSDDPVNFINGIVVHGDGVVIRDCHFEYLRVNHKELIVMDCCKDFIVDNIETHGGSIGVNFGGACPSNGSVINSRFIGANIAGVLVHITSDGQIKNNVFDRCGSGIMTDAGYYGCVRGLTIEENDIHNSHDHGILFYGTIESSISNNTIINNFDKGITMMPRMECSGSNPVQDCFYSTANVIANNVVTGNGIDLHHHEKCIGNIWEGNTCETCQGAEIPGCNPITTTAREFLSSIDSAAVDVAADAKLLFVTSGLCDTTGESFKWTYIYQSADQQKNYEFWYKNGQIIKQDSVLMPWLLGEDFVPITKSWIDSDSAIVIADSRGGKEFREAFELQNIGMSLAQSGWLSWSVRYVSQDSIFNTFFDASKEQDVEYNLASPRRQME